MTGALTISYLIPVYNERPILGETVERVVERLRFHPGSEVLLVENGSSDGSAELVEELAARWSGPLVGVRAAHTAKGYGNAMRHGIDMAAGDLLVITAADLPFGFSDLDGALARDPLPRLMIGSKAHPESLVAASAGRRAMSFAFRCLRRGLIRMRVGDSQGTLLVERALAHQIRPLLQAEAFFFSTELIAFAERAGAAPVEIPVDYSRPRIGSTVRPVHDGVRMVRDLWGLRRRLRSLPGPT